MKFVLAFMAALFVTSFSVSAADLDPDQYYDLDSVQLSPMTASALDYGVALAADASWSTTDSANLDSIENSLTNYGANFTVAGMLYDILDYTEYMPNINTQLNNIASALNGVSSNNLADDVYEIRRGISTLSINASTNLTNIYNWISKIWDVGWGYKDAYGNFVKVGNFTATKDRLATIGYVSLSYDTYLENTGNITLYGLVRRIRDVVANEEDIALANDQKANRQEIEESFLGGSSGSTSLGPSDFGELSDLGGSVKDMLSLDGNATVSSFVSGMTAADSAGSGWFSESTRSQLDAVSSSASTYSRSDPYNMSGWQERYYWLIGDDENG